VLQYSCSDLSSCLSQRSSGKFTSSSWSTCWRPLSNILWVRSGRILPCVLLHDSQNCWSQSKQYLNNVHSTAYGWSAVILYTNSFSANLYSVKTKIMAHDIDPATTSIAARLLIWLPDQYPVLAGRPIWMAWAGTCKHPMVLIMYQLRPYVSLRRYCKHLSGTRRQPSNWRQTTSRIASWPTNTSSLASRPSPAGKFSACLQKRRIYHSYSTLIFGVHYCHINLWKTLTLTQTLTSTVNPTW